MNEPIVARHWLAIAAPKAAPAVATTTVLALARIWNANGAEHSVGNAALMTVLAAGAAAGGASLARAGEPVLAAVGYAVSGSLALAGVAGYSDGLSLPLLLWALTTVLAYCFAARHWRQDRRETVAFERQVSERREEHAHIERVETLRAQTQVEVARSGAAYAEQLAQALITRATLPGFDPRTVEAAGLPAIETSKEQ
ncbi:hypothetical protein [Streptomyces aurantiogriseus]|uniref:Uncharacterized protein n=1 Tax=Streptomyces aurantiogriseus TaxID=66870 RepID=A0A918FKR1_9ACTN|nr:hypothetical protein [Streptomyces aurantiogriseus]GGR48477.1 hypothetical protein GCM10010251_76800 [Streptomyces aurantiogriseus]